MTTGQFVRADTTVALIAAKLSLTPDQVRDGLGRLFADLRSRPSEHPGILIEGLGTLTHNKDGFSFYPSADLDSLVNREFASLVPASLHQSGYGALPTRQAIATGTVSRLKTIFLTVLIVVGLQTVAFLVLWQTGFWEGGESPAAGVIPSLTAEKPATGTDGLYADPDPLAGRGTADGVATELGGQVASEEVAAELLKPVSSEQTPGFDVEIGGYTIILASFDNVAPAIREAARFRDIINDLSYPVGVVHTSFRGAELYRVYVGQLPTVDGAVALKEQLADLPSDSWPIRISAGSRLIQ